MPFQRACGGGGGGVWAEPPEPANSSKLEIGAQPGAPGFQTGAWLRGSGPESDIALCTRVRLARNVQGYHFTPRLGEAEARELRDFMVERLQKPGLPEKLAIIDLDSMDELERAVLVERHLISRELAASKRARGVAVDADESVAVMLNEEATRAPLEFVIRRTTCACRCSPRGSSSRASGSAPSASTTR